MPEILPLLTDDDPLGVDDFATHRLPLADAPDAYAKFRAKQDGYVKVLLTRDPAPRQSRTHHPCHRGYTANQPAQLRSVPGHESELTPPADHGEQSYRGSGRLAGAHPLARSSSTRCSTRSTRMAVTSPTPPTTLPRVESHSASSQSSQP